MKILKPFEYTFDLGQLGLFPGYVYLRETSEDVEIASVHILLTGPKDTLDITRAVKADQRLCYKIVGEYLEVEFMSRRTGKKTEPENFDGGDAA